MLEATVYLRAGEVRTLTGAVQAPLGETYLIAGTPTHTLYDAAGAVVTGHDAAPVASWETEAQTEVAAWVQLDTAALAAGLYRLVFAIPITASSTGLTDTIQPEVVTEIVPVPSVFDPWVQEVGRVLHDLVPSEAVDRLEYRHYRSGLAQALYAYSRTWPRVLRSAVPLTGGQWAYPLADLAAGTDPPAAWVSGLSELFALNPTYDPAIQKQGTAVRDLDYLVDEGLAVWSFTRHVPGDGQVADARWTTLQSLTETVSTLPADFSGGAVHFTDICQWAAGWLLCGPLANEASGTNDAAAEMQVIAYRDITDRRAAQGKAMQAQAVAHWSPVNPMLSEESPNPMHLGHGLANLSSRMRGGILAPATSPTARYTPAGPLWQDSARTTAASADTDPVGAWDDASGNARHLLQATTTKRPLLKTGANGINGLSVRRTDALTQYLKAAPFTLNQPWTIYLVVKPLEVVSSHAWFDGNTDLSGAGINFSVGPWNISQEDRGFFSIRAGVYVNGQCYWPGYRWNPGGQAPLPVMFSGCFNGTSSWVRVNDAVQYTVNPGSGNAAGFTLGIRGDNVSLPIKCDFAEIIIYNRVLTASEDAGTLAYLNSRYNLYDPSVPPNAPLVVCHGNSLTWGAYASIEGPAPGSKAWPGCLFRNYGSPVRVINLGVSGMTSTYLNNMEPWHVAPYYNAAAAHKVAVFWEGVNEFAHVSTSPSAAYAKLNSWVTAAKAQGWYTIVATALPSTQATLGTAYWDPLNPTAGFQYAYNQLVLANTAAAHAVVDLAARPKLSDPTNATYYNGDRLHLTDAGYADVELGFRPAILAAP